MSDTNTPQKRQDTCRVLFSMLSLLLARLVIQLRGIDLVTRQGSRHVKDNACIYASTTEFYLKFQQVVN